MNSPRAVVLLSGGLDSSTVVAMAQADGFEIYALSFSYGQRHTAELQSAKNIAKHYKVAKHTVIDIDLRQFGGSALTDDIEVPKGREVDEMADGIPITYVPARNTIFLSYALAWAEVLNAEHIFIGVNAVDYSGYPDCRPEFIEAFERMANLATRIGVEGEGKLHIETPLLRLSKAQIIQQGMALGVNYAQTNSCYDPFDNGAPCRECDACQLREKGFNDEGLVDPLIEHFGLNTA
ncbi:MAG: 7-cyano-7-deazaguanine synthase QueC [Arenicellales bacterium]